MSKPVLRLTDRLRGIYTVAVNDGAGLLNGEDTFTRQFETPPIQKEAADEIERLNEEIADQKVWIDIQNDRILQLKKVLHDAGLTNDGDKIVADNRKQ